MTESVRFYRDVLGMELLYGGEGSAFSSLRAKDTQSAILVARIPILVPGGVEVFLYELLSPR